MWISANTEHLIPRCCQNSEVSLSLKSLCRLILQGGWRRRPDPGFVVAPPLWRARLEVDHALSGPRCSLITLTLHLHGWQLWRQRVRRGRGTVHVTRPTLALHLFPLGIMAVYWFSGMTQIPAALQLRQRAHLKPVASAALTQNVSANICILFFCLSRARHSAVPVWQNITPAVQVRTCVQLRHHSFTARTSQPWRPLPLT